MTWTIEEEEIVVKYYLKHVDDWRHYIDELMHDLKPVNALRTESSVLYRLSNIAYLHTGTGQKNVARQTRDVYNRLKNS